MLLFRGEMKPDFLFEMLVNFRLPCLHFPRRSQCSPVDSYAQSQSMLVLAGKWDEIPITEHGFPYFATGNPSSAGPLSQSVGGNSFGRDSRQHKRHRDSQRYLHAAMIATIHGEVARGTS